MPLHPMIVFLAAWLASFLGTLPFGPVNLSVVDTTIRQSFRAGLWFSAAAAIVEIGQSFVALHFNHSISAYLDSHIWAKVFTAFVFLGIGLAFMLRRNQAGLPRRKWSQNSHFARGLFVALLNPQAIPFWIFVLAYFENSQYMHLSSHHSLQIVLAFFLGVSLGKLGALMLFGLLGQAISRRSHLIQGWMNKAVGGILIGIGLLQGLQAAAG